MAAVVEYRLDAPSVANPDGSLPIDFPGASVVAGPGDTAMGHFDRAIDLAGTTAGATALAGAPVAPNDRAFCVRIAFQANASLASRQNLVESTGVPFSVHLVPGSAANDIHVVTTVATKHHGWSGTSTRFSTPLQPGKWYVADLAFDADTLGVFVDGKLVSVHAFPNGTLDELQGDDLYVGSWVDGQRDRFDGKLAALEWHDEVPPEHLSQLDEARTSAEWFCSYKWEQVRNRVPMGHPQAAPAYDVDSGAWHQPCASALLVYHESVGAAFEMHGAILAYYQANRGQRRNLGYLVSDESVATRNDGRKSVFSRGAIYWSRQTGAIAVLGKIYLAYENLGESGTFGFPTQEASNVAAGLEQQFQGCRIYYRNGTDRAFEVHGAILAKYLATGGVGAWGFPVSDETDLKDGTKVVGKVSEFENATIYWSAGTGAFEVHGDIRRKYDSLGGPDSDLGLPISDEGAIPGVSGAGRFSCFQKGSILWYGSYGSIVVARPFRVFVGRINTKESEGFLMGQNDIYLRMKLWDGGAEVFNRRFPSSGDYGGNNSKNLNVTIPHTVVPNSPGKTATLSIQVWDSDPGNDDHLGHYQYVLDMANGWGMRHNQGIFDTGGFQKINNISWAVHPQVDIATLSETEKFWATGNPSVASLSYQQYASAFRDVDSEAEWWDLTDWLEKAFYELVVKGLAGSGHCFGLSLEAIYARKFLSQFGMPINRFAWAQVKNEAGIKHQYQVGAEAIWWFVGQFVTGNTHDPVDVFNRTRAAFNRGDNPVLCVSQNADFSGAPHCVLPVAWDSSTKPWRITVCDPNAPNTTRTVTVDPDKNTFEFIGSSTYRGGEWSGGRLHYMPWGVLNGRPRTPVWDAILLILAGTVIILGDGSETASLTDSEGNDLDASGKRALDELKKNRRIDQFFVPFKGYAESRRRRLSALDRLTIADVVAARLPVRPVPGRGKGSIAGEVLLRRRAEDSAFEGRTRPIDPRDAVRLSVRELLGRGLVRDVGESFRARPVAFDAILDRAPQFALSDPRVTADLNAALKRKLGDLLQPIRTMSFNHSVRTDSAAKLRYGVKHGLGEFRLESTAARKATAFAVDVTDLGTSRNTVSVASNVDRDLTFEFTSKLGVGSDRLKVTISGLPLEAAKQLKLNLRPGLSGLDLVTSGQTGTARVTIDAVVDKRPVARRFTLPLEDGLRIKPAQAIAEGELHLSVINQLFGPSTGINSLTSE